MEGTTIRDSRMGLIRDSVEATISARGHDIGTRTDHQERGRRRRSIYRREEF